MRSDANLTRNREKGCDVSVVVVGSTRLTWAAAARSDGREASRALTSAACLARTADRARLCLSPIQIQRSTARLRPEKARLRWDQLGILADYISGHCGTGIWPDRALRRSARPSMQCWDGATWPSISRSASPTTRSASPKPSVSELLLGENIILAQFREAFDCLHNVFRGERSRGSRSGCWRGGRGERS
jgi:hypothetical protein